MTTRLGVPQQCAAVATYRAESRGQTHAEVWNGLMLADQNKIRRDLKLPPLRRRSFIRPPAWVPKVGDTVRLRRGTRGVEKNAWRQESTIISFYPNILGGVRLREPLSQLRAWNLENLVLVKRRAE